MEESDRVVQHVDPDPEQLAALLGSPGRRLAPDPLTGAGPAGPAQAPAVHLGAVSGQSAQRHLGIMLEVLLNFTFACLILHHLWSSLRMNVTDLSSVDELRAEASLQTTKKRR